MPKKNEGCVSQRKKIRRPGGKGKDLERPALVAFEKCSSLRSEPKLCFSPLCGFQTISEFVHAALALRCTTEIRISKSQNKLQTDSLISSPPVTLPLAIEEKEDYKRDLGQFCEIFEDPKYQVAESSLEIVDIPAEEQRCGDHEGEGE